MLLFALSETKVFGGEVARHLGVELSLHEERSFDDGEHKTRPLVSVRGKDTYVVQSLHGGPDASANDKLCKLLFFISTLRENGASRVTALVPYLAYSRKDRQTKSRDPVTTKYLAGMFENAGADCVVTLDVHNIAAFQNAFRCKTVHLDTRLLFSNYLCRELASKQLVVLSPDPGGVKRAQLLREMLERLLQRPVGQGFAEKRRSAGVVSGDLLAGDVAGSTVIILDDLIASGGTLSRAAEAVMARGATEAIACAAHGLFTGDARSTLESAPVRFTIVTDAVPAFRLPAEFAAAHLRLLSVAPLFAGCVRCLADGMAITALLGDES